MAMVTWRRPAWERSMWPELRDFERAMNRIFGDVYPVRTEYPPVNVWIGENDIVLTAEMPGVNAEDLDISVQDRTLTLRCARKEEEVEEGATYHRRECPRGGFARSWQLPFEVENAKVEAGMEDGILRLVLPRTEASKPKKVKVKAT